MNFIENLNLIPRILVDKVKSSENGVCFSKKKRVKYKIVLVKIVLEVPYLVEALH